MKALLRLVVVSILLVVACGDQGPKQPYAEGTPEYEFFQKLSDSLDVPVLNPEKAKALITSSEFTVWSFDIMPNLYRMFNRFSDDLDRIPKAQLETQIIQGAQREAERKLLLAAANDQAITVEDSTIQAQLDQIYQSRGGKENFEKFVEQQGFTMEMVQEDVRSQLVIQEYMEDVLETQIEVSDQEIQDAYESDKSFTVRHILFRTQGMSEEDKAKVREKAQEVLEQARAGADFAELAQEHSEDPGSKEKGGLYENIELGRFVPEFEEATLNTPVGEITDLVETDYGYHIIKVIDRQKETEPLDTVRDELVEKIKQSKRRETYNNLLENLKDEYNYQENLEELV